MAVTVEQARKTGQEYRERKMSKDVEWVEHEIDYHLEEYGCSPKGVATMDVRFVTRGAEQELVRRYREAGWKLKFKTRWDKSGSYKYKKRHAILKAAR